MPTRDYINSIFEILGIDTDCDTIEETNEFIELKQNSGDTVRIEQAFDVIGGISSYKITVYDSEDNMTRDIYIYGNSFMTDYKYDNADGLLTETIAYDENGNINERTEYFYSEDSYHLVASSRRYDGNGEIKESTTYDKNGDIASNTFYENGRVMKSVEFEYDDDRNKIRETTRDENGNITSSIGYVRDDEGILTERIIYGQDNNIISRTEFKDYGGKIENEYNKDGSITTRTEYSVSDMEEEKTVYEYDDNGILKAELKYDMTESEYVSFDLGQNVGALVLKTEYNDDGTVSRETEYISSGYIEIRRTTEYDGNQNVTRESTYDSRDRNTITNVYDKGIIAKEITSSGDDPDKNIIQVREFEYNSKGKVSEETVHDLSRELTTKIKYDDDKSINKIEERTTDKDGHIVNETIFKGNIAEFREYDSEGNTKNVTVYNSYSGDWISKTEYGKDGNIEKETVYKYDSDGNMTEISIKETEYDSEGNVVCESVHQENPFVTDDYISDEERAIEIETYDYGMDDDWEDSVD